MTGFRIGRTWMDSVVHTVIGFALRLLPMVMVYAKSNSPVTKRDDAIGLTHDGEREIWACQHAHNACVVNPPSSLRIATAYGRHRTYPSLSSSSSSYSSSARDADRHLHSLHTQFFHAQPRYRAGICLLVDHMVTQWINDKLWYKLLSTATDTSKPKKRHRTVVLFFFFVLLFAF